MCQARVTWARIKDGTSWRRIAIEACRSGDGHIAFAPVLFAAAGEPPIVVELVNGTRYRKHDEHCSVPRSFTGAARARKVRP